MNLVGRYHRVRSIGPQGLSAPYIWDRGRAQELPRIIPAPYDRSERGPNGSKIYGEWIRSRDGIWSPVISGGAYVDLNSAPKPMLYDGTFTSSGAYTTNSTALNNAYAYNSTGNAIASRFTLSHDETLSSVYFFINNPYTGTAANVNDIDLELRNDSTSVGPSTTLHESKTKDPASATGWIASTGWTFALTAGTIYWMIVGDADGNGTDFATLLRHCSQIAGVKYYVNHQAFSTDNGWSGTRTPHQAELVMVLAFSSGRVFGLPFTNSAASTNSTNRRGLRFVAPATCRIFGMTATASSASISGIELWLDGTGPSGSAFATGSARLPAAAINTQSFGYGFGSTQPKIDQNQVYRLVFTYSGNHTSPSRYQIGTGTDANLRAAMWGMGNAYWTEANGTSDWSLDNTSEFPAVEIYVDDFVPAPNIIHAPRYVR